MNKMSKPKKQREEASLEELALRYERAHQSGKRCYARADRLLQEIAARIPSGEEVEIGGGRKLLLTDRFLDLEGKGIIWTPCAARRYDLKIVQP